MTTFTVANQAGLQSAFNSATGGDTIVLKDGDYGGDQGHRRLRQHRHGPRRGRARRHDQPAHRLRRHQHQVRRHQVRQRLNGGTGGRVVSIENGSQNIAVVNSEVTGSVDGVYDGHWGIYVRNSNSVTLDNNNIHDVRSGIVDVRQLQLGGHGNNRSTTSAGTA